MKCFFFISFLIAPTVDTDKFFWKCWIGIYKVIILNAKTYEHKKIQ